MSYEPRTYRQEMQEGRFQSFEVSVEETDLWIGVTEADSLTHLKKEVEIFIRSLRNELKEYIRIFPEFFSSHNAVDIYDDDSLLICSMKQAAAEAATGPMAAVAGAVAQETLKFIENKTDSKEIVVENGGDISVKICDDLVLSPFMGHNKRFENMGLKIDAGYSPLGICSSSGTFGHSYSYGKADLVMVFSKNAALSDAFATAIANRIKDEEHLNIISEALPEGIIGIMGVKNDKMIYNGPFPFVKIAD